MSFKKTGDSPVLGPVNPLSSPKSNEECPGVDKKVRKDKESNNEKSLPDFTGNCSR